MARYHVNPETGDPGPCRARKNCPFGGDEIHFDNAARARENYERLQSLIHDPKQIKPKSSKLTDAAFASELNYQGKVPRWFKKASSPLQKAVFDCEPELLDVIHGPHGKLAVVWEDNSIEPNDIYLSVERGYITTRLTLRDFRSGEVMAYLKTAYQTPESQARSYGTDEWRGMRYLAERHSFYDMEREYPEHRDYSPQDTEIPRVVYSPPKLETEEQLQKFIGNARQRLNLYGRPRVEELDKAALEKELKFLQKEANKRLEVDLENYQTPYIDFSRVEEPLRGKGVGHSLYIYTAKKLAQRGRSLRASGTQSDEAQKSWRLMAADSRFPITAKNWLYRWENGSTIQACYELDFRDPDSKEK